MTKRIFITGTDTNVGKTLVVCSIMQFAVKLNYNVAGYKPIASSCTQYVSGIKSKDALLLMKIVI
ncbi:MAG: ATP-dependent dethiobiotin synthetase BioD [Enterobacterales bacterium]